MNTLVYKTIQVSAPFLTRQSNTRDQPVLNHEHQQRTQAEATFLSRSERAKVVRHEQETRAFFISPSVLLANSPQPHQPTKPIALAFFLFSLCGVMRRANKGF